MIRPARLPRVRNNMRSAKLYNLSLFIAVLIVVGLYSGGCQSSKSIHEAAQTSVGNITAEVAIGKKELESAKVGANATSIVHIENASGHFDSIAHNLAPIVASIKQGIADAAWKADVENWWLGPKFWRTLTWTLIIAGIFVGLSIFLAFMTGAGPIVGEGAYYILHTMWAGILKLTKLDTWLKARLQTVRNEVHAAVSASPVVAAAKADAAASLTSVGILAPATTPVSTVGTQQTPLSLDLTGAIK